MRFPVKRSQKFPRNLPVRVKSQNKTPAHQNCKRVHVIFHFCHSFRHLFSSTSRFGFYSSNKNHSNQILERENDQSNNCRVEIEIPYKGFRPSANQKSKQDPDGEIENSGKKHRKSRIPNFCYIQVIVFDLSYTSLAAVGTQQVRNHEKKREK